MSVSSPSGAPALQEGRAANFITNARRDRGKHLLCTCRSSSSSSTDAQAPAGWEWAPQQPSHDRYVSRSTCAAAIAHRLAVPQSAHLSALLELLRDGPWKIYGISASGHSHQGRHGDKAAPHWSKNAAGPGSWVGSSRKTRPSNRTTRAEPNQRFFWRLTRNCAMNRQSSESRMALWRCRLGRRFCEQNSARASGAPPGCDE